jgi:hypothetical protein
LFNRPEYVERSLNSIYKQLRVIDQRKLYIYIDGFKGSSYDFMGLEDNTVQVKKMAKRFFPDAKVVKFQKNCGIADLHNRLQKAAFSGRDQWSLFFEEDVDLDPHYLDEISKLIQVVQDCEQIVRVACFQILPTLYHLPRGNYGFYPGHGTKAFAERKSFFLEKQPIVNTFLKLAAKNLGSSKQFIDSQNSAEIALMGHFLPYFQHDSLVESLLHSKSKLHVVTKPYLARDIGEVGMNNYTVAPIEMDSSFPELEKQLYSRKEELMQQLEQIKSESENYLKSQYKEIFERFHVVSSRKTMLKKILN